MDKDIQTFTAKVRKIDINPYVEVPEDILRKLRQDAKKERGPISVKGTLQSKPFSTTIVKFRGMWRLYLNTPMRQAANVDVGDQVTISVQFDQTPPKVPVPRKLTLALSKNKTAKEAFQKLAPSRQKEILRYLNSLKQVETLDRNVEKVIQFLQGEPIEGLVAVTRAKRRTTDEST
jgi:hypothetical protein